MLGIGRHDDAAGLVIRMPGLGLKLEEDGDPLLLAGKLEDQAAVLPGAVLLGEAAGRVALVEVDVVDAAARLESEILVGLGLGPQVSPKA